MKQVATPGHNRYVRMMLRRYPKMRWEWFSWNDRGGINVICGTTFEMRLAYAREALVKESKQWISAQIATSL